MLEFSISESELRFRFDWEFYSWCWISRLEPATFLAMPGSYKSTLTAFVTDFVIHKQTRPRDSRGLCIERVMTGQTHKPEMNTANLPRLFWTSPVSCQCLGESLLLFSPLLRYWGVCCWLQIRNSWAEAVVIIYKEGADDEALFPQLWERWRLPGNVLELNILSSLVWE